MVRFKHFFTILVIIFFAGVKFPWMETATSTVDIIKGNLINQMIDIAIYIIVILMLFTKWKYVVRLSANNIFIWLILIWVFASFLWSAEPSLTLRRAFGLLGTTLIGLYFASFYDQEQFTRIACWSFLIMNIVSLLVIIILPSRGFVYSHFGWTGIYFHKNGLGRISLFGIILFPALFTNNKKKQPWIIGIALSIILLIGSRSITSLLIATVAVILWITIPLLNDKSKNISVIIICFFVIILILGIWIYLTNDIEILLNVLGKDTTLSKRTVIWDFVQFSIRQSPWLGSGYGAFWIGRNFGPSSPIWNELSIYIQSAHNGYLQMCLEIGIIGTILVSIFIISILFRLFSIIRNKKKGIYYWIWPIVFLFALILYNITETYLLEQNSIPWLFISFFCFNRTAVNLRK